MDQPNGYINGIDFDDVLQQARLTLHYRIDIRLKLLERLDLFKKTGMMIYDTSEMWRVHIEAYGEPDYQLWECIPGKGWVRVGQHKQHIVDYKKI